LITALAAAAAVAASIVAGVSTNPSFPPGGTKLEASFERVREEIKSEFTGAGVKFLRGVEICLCKIGEGLVTASE
jgi:hypothetical protein